VGREKTSKSDPSVKTRRETERLAIREKILNAATDLLLQQGLEAFSMRKLADQIGYTATTLYIHFPDREGLLGEVVDRQFFQFRKNFERIGKIIDPIERLREMGMAFVRFGVEHCDHYRLMFLTSLHSIPKGRFLEKGNPSQDCYAYLRATVSEGLDAHRFRHEFKSADEVAQIFFAGVHGVVSLHIVKGNDDWVKWVPVRRTAQALIDGLIRGLTVGGTDRPTKRKVSKISSSRART
jgi:AcrR family transcriptional regulator